jgi:hypothetical protein
MFSIPPIRLHHLVTDKLYCMEESSFLLSNNDELVCYLNVFIHGAFFIRILSMTKCFKGFQTNLIFRDKNFGSTNYVDFFLLNL